MNKFLKANYPFIEGYHTHLKSSGFNSDAIEKELQLLELYKKNPPTSLLEKVAIGGAATFLLGPFGLALGLIASVETEIERDAQTAFNRYNEFSSVSNRH